MNNEFLIQLQDGVIKEIYTDTDCYSGCETCDFGSQYINEFEVELSGGKIKVEVEQMYGYELNEDYMMKLFLQNIELIKSFTEIQFYYWLVEKMESLKSNVEDVRITTTFDIIKW